MKELTAFEVECVSGAGWLQNGLAFIGSKVGAAAWSASSGNLTFDLPLVGPVNLSTLAPDLGEKIGENFGYTIGGNIENKIASLPVIGGLLNKLLGN